MVFSHLKAQNCRNDTGCKGKIFNWIRSRRHSNVRLHIQKAEKPASAQSLRLDVPASMTGHQRRPGEFLASCWSSAYAGKPKNVIGISEKDSSSSNDTDDRCTDPQG